MARIASFAAAALAVATVAGFAATASAQATSGTIRLQGTVALACTVSVTDLNQSLNLVQGETNKQVGSVVETCNSGTGYSITVTSANNGTLTSTGNGTQPIAFTLGYDGQSSNLNSGLQLTRSSAQFDKTVPVTVTVPAASNRIAGTYNDTITVTIAAR